MMVPCQMGFMCPHSTGDIDGDACCIHPYTVRDLKILDTLDMDIQDLDTTSDGLIGEIDRPLIEKDSFLDNVCMVTPSDADLHDLSEKIQSKFEDDDGWEEDIEDYIDLIYDDGGYE